MKSEIASESPGAMPNLRAVIEGWAKADRARRKVTSVVVLLILLAVVFGVVAFQTLSGLAFAAVIGAGIVLAKFVSRNFDLNRNEWASDDLVLYLANHCDVPAQAKLAIAEQISRYGGVTMGFLVDLDIQLKQDWHRTPRGEGHLRMLAVAGFDRVDRDVPLRTVTASSSASASSAD